MSYFPKKGMYRDNGRVNRFAEQTEERRPYAAKRWFHVEVVRRVVDGKGETMKKNKQVAEVFAKETDVISFAMRRCPDPWVGDGSGTPIMNIYWRPLEEDRF